MTDFGLFTVGNHSIRICSMRICDPSKIWKRWALTSPKKSGVGRGKEGTRDARSQNETAEQIEFLNHQNRFPKLIVETGRPVLRSRR
jgi:hypothetical protein